VLIVVTDKGIVTEVRPEQYWNALLPIVVNKAFVGNVTEVRLVQLWNALVLIELTELGIVMEVRPVQLWNALAPIEVIELGIVYVVLPFPAGYWINVVLRLLNNTPLLSLL